MAVIKLKLLPSSVMKAKTVTRLVGQVTAGTGITVVSVAGNYTVSLDTSLSGALYQSLDADLTAIAALATTGFAKRTAANTWSLASETGTGAVVLANTPTLITPVLGAATATSINGLGLTGSGSSLSVDGGKAARFKNTIIISGTDAAEASFGANFTTTGVLEINGGGSTLNITGGKVVSLSNTLTLAGTDGVTLTFGNSGTFNNAGTLDIDGGKTFRSTNTLTLSGTDGITVNFGTAGGTIQALAYSGSAADLSTGTLPAARLPAHTGDATSSAGSAALTLATVNGNVGTFGSATQSVQFTVNAKGLMTAAANVTVTPAVGSITGVGAGGATALGVAVGTDGAFVVKGGALGSPSSAGTMPAFTLGGPITANGQTAPGLGQVTPWVGNYASGRYYTGIPSGGTGTGAIAVNTVYFFPLIVGETRTFDRIAVEITAAGTAANIRLAIYNSANGLPSTLVVDGGSLAVAGTGMKASTISQSLLPGVYFLAVVADGTATLTGIPHIHLGAWWGIGATTLSAPDSQITATLTFGAYPATAFAGGMGAATYTAATIPVIAVRA